MSKLLSVTSALRRLASRIPQDLLAPCGQVVGFGCGSLPLEAALQVPALTHAGTAPPTPTVSASEPPTPTQLPTAPGLLGSPARPVPGGVAQQTGGSPAQSQPTSSGEAPEAPVLRLPRPPDATLKRKGSSGLEEKARR